MGLPQAAHWQKQLKFTWHVQLCRKLLPKFSGTVDTLFHLHSLDGNEGTDIQGTQPGMFPLVLCHVDPLVGNSGSIKRTLNDSIR